MCPGAPDNATRCDHCPLDRLQEAETSPEGLLLKRALDLRAALKLGFRVGLDEVPADEFYALTLLEDEQARYEEEQAAQR